MNTFTAEKRSKPVIVITGASGFIGSDLSLDLSRDFTVIAIDWREPSDAMRRAGPQIQWHIMDITDTKGVPELFKGLSQDPGRIDFVIHLAAYYDFGNRWVPEYQRTNVEGTANLLDACIHAGVKRLLFASSIAAMEPSSPGVFLTEESPCSESLPYAKSKAMGERLVAEASTQLPANILRIAGVFSDWCELPPLYGLIKLWSSAYPMGCIIPGRGESGIPYIYKSDLVRLVRKCILKDHDLGPFNIFLASQHGAVSYRQLFPLIRSASAHPGILRSFHIPNKVAKASTWIRNVLGGITGHRPFEKPWMMDLVDKSWNMDTTRTRQLLDWDCSPELDIRKKIPDIMYHLKKDPKGWEKRNLFRNERNFSYT